MQGVSMKKHNNGNEKKGRIFFVGTRYLPSIPKGVVHSRWSVSVIIVTTVITIKKGNEKKRTARVCFGTSFIPKKHH